MFMMGFEGTSVSASDRIARDIGEQGLGGVVLFGRNVRTPAQLTQLTADLQSFARRPLLIATDEEGGQVARLGPADGFPATQSAKSLGEKNDLDYTHTEAAKMAMTLRDAGINTNLAPVYDVNVNPDNPIIAKYDRSFSSDPQIVASQALEFVRAHHEFGILTTLKHFPGHGSSTADSHVGFVDVTGLWSESELTPFETIIDAGEADLVMMAHIFNADLDLDHPASLSHLTTTGLLRNRLGYHGVVISDSMQLGAITQNYSFEDAILLAAKAGVDILAYANNEPGDRDTFNRARSVLLAAVKDGAITERRIDESYRRITAL
jgi:beta-N-acetylhexosaminidase